MSEFETKFDAAVKPAEDWIEAPPPPCAVCGRPYEEHSTAISLRKDGDSPRTWYTGGCGERCPTSPTGEDGAYYTRPAPAPETGESES